MRYIGGKSRLLHDIDMIVRENTSGGERVFCDIFSGTGSVARHFKPRYEIISNDILHFSYVIQKATVENNTKPVFGKLARFGIADPLKFLEDADIPDPMKVSHDDRINANIPDLMKVSHDDPTNADIPETGQIPSFIADNYSPGADCDRMYISKRNAERIDFIRGTIEAWRNAALIDEIEYFYLLAALIEGVPFVSNITGTYGAYLKEWDKRALKALEMARLDVIDNGRSNHSYNMDANKLIREIEGDILYLDPPYNARQYAPNYHLLETISRYDHPKITGVTGMRPYDDTRSAFCVKAEVLDVFEELIEKAQFSNIVMSYSTDGLMTAAQIEGVFRRHGIERSYKRYDIPYRKYKSKITNEAKTLKEHFFYIRKHIPRVSVFPIAPVLQADKAVAPKESLNCAPGNMHFKYLKSPLNYIGGKYKLLPQIIPLLPRRIGAFVDLFAGGCNVGINVNAERVICNDLNTKIIDMFRAFQQTDTAEILERIEARIRAYGLSKENAQGFADFREYYNQTQDPIDLYTLTCYSFNYQFRFNNNLEYNNPFGRNRSRFSANMRDHLLAFLGRIKDIDIVFMSRDFAQVDVSWLGCDDFVYCDPPYLITTGSYNDGNRGFKDWGEKQEVALYELLDRLHRRGVRFALSNVLTHKGVRNELLLDWCEKYVVTALDNDYSNSSYNTQRGKSSEVLVTNY